MDTFTIFPAIDLRKGQVVRLRQGDPNQQTNYSSDPEFIARKMLAQGSRWLHVVNLDGAFGDAGEVPINLRQLARIRGAVDLPIQFGGGLRTVDAMAEALELGATRLVLGTVAIQNPALVPAAIARFGPDRIVVGIDARDGLVATHGWQQTSTVTAIDLGNLMREMGLLRTVYTDIARDGMLSGVNVLATAELAAATGLRVIASGGVRDLADIRSLVEQEGQGVEGVIIGQALYSGQIELREALSVANRGAGASSASG